MKNHIPTLKRILSKAYISPMLHRAITDTIQALQNKNLALACELTACKSFVTTWGSHIKQYAFQEDHNYNKTQLKNTVYSLLDGIHSDIAWKLGEMPCGMVIVSSGPKGMTWHERQPKGTHPVIKRIRFERKALNKLFNQERP